MNYTRLTISIHNHCLPCKKLYFTKSVQPAYIRFLDGYYEIEVIFPRTIEVTKSQFIYPLQTFGAELGGWIGLFLGLSVLDVYDVILSLAFIIP